jgi:transcription elongation factor Elf1
MPNVDTHVVKFQCPSCGHDLERSIGRLKSSEHMQCPGCGVGINIDTDRLATQLAHIDTQSGRLP